MAASIRFIKKEKTMKNYFIPLLITAAFTVSACETGYGENTAEKVDPTVEQKVDQKVDHRLYTDDRSIRRLTVTRKPLKS